jgi:uncharacterized protein
MTDVAPELQEQLSRMANVELFAIFMTPTDRFQSPLTHEGGRLLAAHLRYLFELQDQRRLLASGPLDLNIERIEGMCIVAAASREEAETIAAQEPFAKAGWRTNTVRAWQLNEGVLVPAARAAASGADTP